jgi:hypothetical protein
MSKQSVADLTAAGADLVYLRSQAAGMYRKGFMEAAIAHNGAVPADKIQTILNNGQHQFFKDLTAGVDPLNLHDLLTPGDIAHAIEELRAGRIVRPSGNGSSGSSESKTPAGATPPAAGPVTDTIMESLGGAFEDLRQNPAAVPTTAPALYQKLWQVLPEEVQVSRSDMVLGGALVGLSKDQVSQVVAKLQPETRTAVMDAVREVAPDKINANVRDAVTSVYHLNLVAGNLSGWDNGIKLAIDAMSQDQPITWTAGDEDRAKATVQFVLGTLRTLYAKLEAERKAAADAPAPLAKLPWAEVRDLFKPEARPGMEVLWDGQPAEVQHKLADTARQEAAARAETETKDAGEDAPAETPDAPAADATPAPKAPVTGARGSGQRKA